MYFRFKTISNLAKTSGDLFLQIAFNYFIFASVVTISISLPVYQQVRAYTLI